MYFNIALALTVYLSQMAHWWTIDSWCFPGYMSQCLRRKVVYVLPKLSLYTIIERWTNMCVNNMWKLYRLDWC